MGKSLRVRRLKTGAILFTLVSSYSAVGAVAPARAMPRTASFATATPAPQAAVIGVTLIPATRAAATLHALFPHAKIRVDIHANALVVLAPPDDVQQMRTVVQGIDVRDPSAPTTDIIVLHALKPAAIISRLHGLYPNALIEATSKGTLLVRAVPRELAELTALISSLDVVPPTAAPTVQPEDAVHVIQSNPRTLARALAKEIPALRASVSGSSIILVGPQEAVEKAKTLAQDLDMPAFGTEYTQVYRLHNVDATSVADLIKRSFPKIKVTVDNELNAISVLGTAAEEQRIANAIAQLDGTGEVGQGGAPAPAAYGDGNIAVVQLHDAMPGQNGSPSTSAQDIASAVQQALGSMAPDLHVTVPANSSQIILAGSPQAIGLAKDLISKLDAPQPLVVLDTEVLEVDENSARNIGLQLPGATISSTWQEVQPTPDPFTGQPGHIGKLQQLTRTPIQFTAELNLLVQKGDARVLADPRVATISGHTASIRAGDTIGILTQSGGGVGTPVTQQLQTFQTGVTLDITPQVGPEGNVIVSLHPVVNSLEGILNGVPQIATRDTQTVVQLDDNQTLIIGGLIQQTLQHTVSKVPLLGDIPLVGKLFQNSDTQSTRNELIIVVTPHIVKPGTTPPAPNATLPIPTPQPLPTLPPGTQLPADVLPPHAPQPGSRFVPMPSPLVSQEGATPMPTPSAFASANMFVYGSPPPSTYLPDGAAPQIYYAQFSPTILKNGAPVQISVIASSNVRKVEIGYPGYMTMLTEIAPSKWQATYNFNASGIASGQDPIMLQLNAYASSGTAVTVQVPVSLLR